MFHIIELESTPSVQTSAKEYVSVHNIKLVHDTENSLTTKIVIIIVRLLAK